VKTQTATIPSQKITVSVLTNAADGNPQLLLEGVVHILRAFAKHGPPAKSVAGWRGRWWSLWDAIDLVPLGAQVMVAAPGEAVAAGAPPHMNDMCSPGVTSPP